MNSSISIFKDKIEVDSFFIKKVYDYEIDEDGFRYKYQVGFQTYLSITIERIYIKLVFI